MVTVTLKHNKMTISKNTNNLKTAKPNLNLLYYIFGIRKEALSSSENIQGFIIYQLVFFFTFVMGIILLNKFFWLFRKNRITFVLIVFFYICKNNVVTSCLNIWTNPAHGCQK